VAPERHHDEQVVLVEVCDVFGDGLARIGGQPGVRSHLREVQPEHRRRGQAAPIAADGDATGGSDLLRKGLDHCLIQLGVHGMQVRDVLRDDRADVGRALGCDGHA